MENITSGSHYVVGDDNGEVLTQNNNVLICERTTNNLMYVPISSEITKIFGFYIRDEINHNKLFNGEGTTSESTHKWGTNATRALINLYKKHENKILSNSVRNDTAYSAISDDLAAAGFQFSSTQCKDKLKYLKMRYMKVKDQKKQSGAASIHFEFFDDMDLIFGKKPNTSPLAIASSSGINNYNSDAQGTMNESDVLVEDLAPKKKRKVSIEDEINRRHEERLQMQQKAIDSFESIMTKLIDKL